MTEDRMSQFAAVQIPKPTDEQTFERQNVVLWRGLLKDPNVQKVGRRGQGQSGVDLVGQRGRDPTQWVGVQCKLKGAGKQLTEAEVRAEVAAALEFTPSLREYFIVTTAPDHAPLQALARQLTLEHHKTGRPMEVQVWGWNTLEDRILEDVDAHKAFDPSFSAFGAKLADTVTEVRVTQIEIRDRAETAFSQIQADLRDIKRMGAASGRISDDTQRDAIEALLDGQIDDIRAGIDEDAATAQLHFERLLQRVGDTASGRILFRIEANIGACKLALGDEAGAAERLIAAHLRAPEEPKAVINRVLGLLLKREWTTARQVAAQALADGLEDPTLASYVIQACRFEPSVDDPLSGLPKVLWSAPPVKVTLIDFRRHRGDKDWRSDARRLLRELPDDDHLRRIAAEADIEDALDHVNTEATRQLGGDLRDRVVAATVALRELWEKANNSGNGPQSDDAGICANLLLGLHLLEDFATAFQVADQAREAFAEDAELARYVAIVWMDGGAAERIDEILPLLEQETAGRLIAFRFETNRQNWPKAATLASDALTAAPDSERGVIEVLATIAKLEVAGGDREPDLTALLETVHEDPRSAILIASHARQLGLEELAQQAYDKAQSLLTPDSHIARRLMVARHAYRLEDWSVVAEALDGWIDVTTDSEELRVLARAYVNERPARRRGGKFFRSLPQPLRELPAYSQAAGLFHFNQGALPAAEPALRRGMAGGMLLSALALFETLARQGREHEIGPLVAGLDPDALVGEPESRMRLARFMKMAGNGEGAARLAWETLRAAPDDADVAMGYFGLVVMDTGDRLIPDVTTVSPGTWIDLRSDDNSTAQFLIVEENARTDAGEATVDHPLVKKALGLRVGDTFEMETGLAGMARTWRVEGLKHKYLWAFHDICENFETRFPDARGLWRFTVQDDDIQPALDLIKRMGEADERKAALYLDKGLPLSMVASQFTGGSIGFADFVRRLGRDIETSVGLDQERLAALELIQTRRDRGVVLDAYTAWTVATMELFPVLKSVFGIIRLPESAISELRGLRRRFSDRDGESLTLGWADGEFFGSRMSAEETAGQLVQLDGFIAALEQNCEIVPVEAPDVLKPVEEAIALNFGCQVLDPAYLALDRNLLSEDRRYRDAVREMQGVASLWLQPVLVWARDHDVITDVQYAEHLVGLCARRHGHVGSDGRSFAIIFDQDDSDTLVRFRELTRYLAGPTADMVSHLIVTIGLINTLWRTPERSPLKVMKATGILIEALIREPTRPWAQVLAVLGMELDEGPAAYVRGWVRGHFLPTAELQAAINDLKSIDGVVIRETLRRQAGRSRHRFDSPRPGV